MNRTLKKILEEIIGEPLRKEKKQVIIPIEDLLKIKINQRKK